MRNRFLGIVLLFSLIGLTRGAIGVIEPGARWFDTDGNRIQAHSAGILKKDGVYYWYGQDMTLGNFARIGVSCYSSTDLESWKREGVVFRKEELPEDLQDEKGVCERPKVIYNPLSKKYVMWMHLDNGNYKVASAGIAVSDSPVGPFRYIKKIRPIKYDFGYPENDRCNQAEQGNTYRDMNLFVDDDGHAYVFYSSEDNATMYIGRLNEKFTDIQRPVVEGKTWSRNFPNCFREAPAPFKCRGKYYLITSGCSGWDPNPAAYAVADHILGPWMELGDPCVGAGAETTFRSQSTFVLPAPGKPEGCFIYLGDRWFGRTLEDSRYVWLPFVINEDGKIAIENYPHWDLSVFDKEPFNENDVPVVDLKQYRDADNQLSAKLTWKPIDGADLYRIYRNGHYFETTREYVYRSEDFEPNRRYTFQVQAVTVHGEESQRSDIIRFDTGAPKKSYLSDWTPDFSKQDFGALARDVGMDGMPMGIGDRTFEKGLGTHANSTVSYNLYGMYKNFSAFVGVDKGQPGTVSFVVYCDGEERFRSPVMSTGMDALSLKVNLDGVNELKLVVSDGGNGITCDHANWADAMVE